MPRTKKALLLAAGTLITGVAVAASIVKTRHDYKNALPEDRAAEIFYNLTAEEENYQDSQQQTRKVKRVGGFGCGVVVVSEQTRYFCDYSALGTMDEQSEQKLYNSMQGSARQIPLEIKQLGDLVCEKRVYPEDQKPTYSCYQLK